MGDERRPYPYLFWEGFGAALPPPDEGWVVRRDEVAEFFRTTLPRLGLSSREAEDFTSAWAPRLSESPYYLITFLPQRLIDAMAPLDVSPAPDTVIRVLMDYRPLAERMAVAPVDLPAPPPRRGFTVVEWGGVRR